MADDDSVNIDDDAHSRHSSYREKLLEHRFVSEVLQAMWLQGEVVDVLKAEVDGGGFDLVLQARGVMRHVQLKTVKAGGATSEWKVALRLADYPSGCVIVITVNPDTMAIGPFLWLGDEPGLPLPGISHHKVAKHTKGDGDGTKNERPNHRVIRKSQFTSLPTISAVIDTLFGGNGPISAFRSPLSNSALENQLRRTGHPFIQFSWSAGEFHAVGHPGAKVADADFAHQGNYLTVLLAIAKQAGVDANVHDGIGDLPPVVMIGTADPAAALQFLSICHLYQVALLPLATVAFGAKSG